MSLLRMIAYEPISGDPLLNGLTVLVVEDEALISFLVEDMLQDLGCSTVWHATGACEALSMLRNRRPDAAVIDVNLGGQLGYPLAVYLDAAAIPFVFATGYGRNGIPSHWGRRPIVHKPFGARALAAALGSALRLRPASVGGSEPENRPFA
jgi:DNA-binding response OmpR family regulator